MPSDGLLFRNVGTHFGLVKFDLLKRLLFGALGALVAAVILESFLRSAPVGTILVKWLQFCVMFSLGILIAELIDAVSESVVPKSELPGFRKKLRAVYLLVFAVFIAILIWM